MCFKICDRRCLAVLVFLVAVLSHLESPSARGDANAVTIRVAAVSFRPKKFDLPGNADKLEQMFRRAKQGGAKIAVAPEGALDGYVVDDIITGQAAESKMNKVAISIDHSIIGRFQALGDELDICLVFGFAERIGDNVFNCALFIDDKGKICGKYHKMQFAEGYDSSWWFNRLGLHSRAFDTPYGRCGIMICNDRWNPALAEIPVLDGAQFLLIPAFGSCSKSQDDAVLKRGQENNVPVIEANVGVTLIVNNNKITAVDRQVDGITFGEITIRPQTDAQPAKRDEVERIFLAWREEEMQRRFNFRQQHREIKNNPKR